MHFKNKDNKQIRTYSYSESLLFTVNNKPWFKQLKNKELIIYNKYR